MPDHVTVGPGRPIAVRFTTALEAHLYKHCAESPEIQPHFVERIIAEAEPVVVYVHRASDRYVLEGYIGCKPYRVVMEIIEEKDRTVVFPISAHRIKHKDFLRTCMNIGRN